MRGELSREEAEAQPNREALISYLGAPSLEEVGLSLAPFLLEKGDLVILCSDGLCKPLSDERILALCHEGGASLAELASRLVFGAVEAGGSTQDNTTVLLMRYDGASPTSAGA